MLETHLTGLEPWSLKKNRARDELDLEPLAVVLVIKPECYEKKRTLKTYLQGLKKHQMRLEPFCCCRWVLIRCSGGLYV